MQVQETEIPRTRSRGAEGMLFNDVAAAFEITVDELFELCKNLKITPLFHKKQFFIHESEMRLLMEVRGHRFPDRAQRISLMMCKGGVGKTTVSFYLAQRLAQYGARVLVIDTDPQGNLTSALCRAFQMMDISEATPVLMDVLSRRCPLHQAIQVLRPNLHMIPSTALNSLLDKKLAEASAIPVFELHRYLSMIDSQYDYIIIDSAPALNLVNASIMYASDRILLPLFMYEFSLMGLQQTLSELRDCQRTYKFTTQPHVLVNKFNHRERLSFGYVGQLAQDYRHLILKSVVRSSSQLQSCIATGRSLFAMNKAQGKVDFDSLAREILELKGHAL